MSDLGPVIITAREVYDAVIRVSTQVTDLSAQITAVAKDQVEIAKSMDDHEARIRSLERGRWPIQSLTVLISIAALAVAFFLKK